MADLSRGLPNQAPLLLMEPPLPDLRHGVVGRNQQALDWLSAWMSPTTAEVSARQAATTPSVGVALPSSLLLWGAAGAGKSFWLQAWALARPGLQVYDLEEATQAQAFLASVEAAHVPRVWLIDNIDRASAEVQQALFALFIAIQQTYGPGSQRLVATARAAPAQLVDQLREDLRTRLGQGLVFELHELDDQEKLQALRERAFRLGWMSAPIASDYDHLFRYMLARLPRQLGRLMRLLEALDARALSLKRPVSLPLMRSLLEENLALF
ncbi:MAG: HdaA/DnaA family protein [Burkholderiaceae bacterium]|jgi:DnaA family protein